MRALPRCSCCTTPRCPPLERAAASPVACSRNRAAHAFSHPIPLPLFLLPLLFLLLPQGFAEKLFKRLSGGHERFETRIAILNVVSRCVGVHKLLILNFYPFLQVGGQAGRGGCQLAGAGSCGGCLTCSAADLPLGA